MTASGAFALPLALLQAQVTRARFLPAAYARYQPLVADGLRRFLEQLSPDRLSRIFIEQAALPAATPTAARLVALLHHVPALHKLGQVVARDRRLQPGFRRRLHRLESFPARTPMPVALELLEAELPGWHRLGLDLGPAPLAEGSVALILPFTCRSDGTQGVFKLLKPGAGERLDEDLAALGELGDFLEAAPERYRLPPLDYRDTFDTLRRLLLHEVKLEEEQTHLAEAARVYAADPSVLIPALLPFSTPRLTAMTRVPGTKIVDRLPPEPAVRRRLAHALANALAAQPMFSPHPSALFHADPHAGNLLLTPQGQVGIIDWSLIGRLEKRPRVHLAQVLLGALTLDPDRMQRALAGVRRTTPAASPARPHPTPAVQGEREEALRATLEASLRRLRHGAPPGLSWLTGLLDQLVARTGLALHGDLLLFRKSLLTLEGVLADVLPEAEAATVLDEAVLTALWRREAAEWPGRWWAPFDSRAFGSHLSNADLFTLLQALPVAALRWWRAALHEAKLDPA